MYRQIQVHFYPHILPSSNEEVRVTYVSLYSTHYDTNNNGIVDNAETLGGYTLSEIMLKIYPVGSIKFSTENVNPGTYIGGTWVAWGQGRVPIGVDSGDSDFDTAEETGGSKTSSHYHIEAIGNDGTAIYVKQATTATSVVTTGLRATISVTGSNAPGRYSYTSTSDVDILPPYITCYMWKRTA